MNPIKQKAPGSNPRPSKTRDSASAVPRSNEQINSGTAPASEQVNTRKGYVLASFKYDAPIESPVSEAQTTYEKAFELIDHHTAARLAQAGCADWHALFYELMRHSAYDPKTDTIRYYSVTHSELILNLCWSESKVKRGIKALEAAGFITTCLQWQMTGQHRAGQAGNAYVCHSRQFRKSPITIHYEWSVDTADSEPMTQTPEAELKVTLEPSLGVSTPGEPEPSLGVSIPPELEQVVRRSIRLMNYPGINTPSSSTASFTSTRGGSNLNPPGVTERPLISYLKDLDKDLIKPDGKKSSDHSKLKGKRASDSQLELVRQRLSTDRQRAALIHYGLEELSQLTSPMANELIMASNKLKPELLNLLDLTLSERKAKAQSEVRAREQAAEERERAADTQSKKAEQVSLYGRELTEAEWDRRTLLIRKSRYSKAEPAVRARGRKLKEVEALFVITPEARLAHLLELITAA